MKGDFSRFTFNPQNRYSRVLMQQGRVQLDADWNEQLDISAYRTETEITDFIGQSGAPENPKDAEGQSRSFRITADPNNISIDEGRYYVEGKLFENHETILFTSQPDYPAALPTTPGIYLAYLDVWQHHITALEVPTLREVALGGADTTTRVKNVWQVKLHYLGAKGTVSAEVSGFAPGKWQPAWNDISTGTLMVRVQPGAILENQLYRVEIHQGNAVEGDQNPDVSPEATPTVTFKWSRDNGSIAAQVESLENDIINIKNAGRDTQLAFPFGQLIEVSHETLTLRNQPGILATVQTVQGDRLTVKWKTVDGKSLENLKNLIVRRWDSSDAIEISRSNEHELEQSITVQFELNKRYRTGDYWLIPSRALTGIESPSEPQPPHGVQHYYCSLALLERTDTQFTVLADCRSIFKPITSGLLSKAGDTMRGDLTIAQDLKVMGNVGIGTTNPNAFTKARLVVNSEVPNSGNVNNVNQTNRLESVLALKRNGVGFRSWDNIADFQIGRYSDQEGFASRTQLDVILSHGELDKEGAFQKVMTLRSNGNVGIGTTAPAAKLHINGDFMIERGQLIRGVPVISFLSGSARIPVSRSESGGAQIEFNFPSDVIQVEAFIKGWHLKFENTDANQSISEMAVRANISEIKQTKVTVNVEYIWFVNPPKPSSGPSPNRAGLDVTVVVIAAMNRSL